MLFGRWRFGVVVRSLDSGLFLVTKPWYPICRRRCRRMTSPKKRFMSPVSTVHSKYEMEIKAREEREDPKTKEQR
jgi:hypothetical protein